MQSLVGVEVRRVRERVYHPFEAFPFLENKATAVQAHSSSCTCKLRKSKDNKGREVYRTVKK